MSIEALNRVDPHAIVDQHEDALAAAYQKVLRDAGRKAASRFRRLAPFAQTAAAEPKQPNWAPPNIDELVDLPLIAEETAKATRTLHTTALAAVLDAYGDTAKPAGVEVGQPSFDVTNPSSIAMLDSFDARAGDVAKSVRDDLQKTIADAYTQGFSVDQTAKNIVAQSDQFSIAQARMLARTSLNGIANGGSHAAAEAAGAAFKTWTATEDERTRETHSDADGQTVPIGQQFEVGGEACDYPGDPQLSDAEACNCFPRDVAVTMPGLRAVAQRRYEGDLVRVRFVSGDELAGTPNHPVLRSDGCWVALGDLEKGDYLVRATFARQHTGAPDDECPPAEIGEVYRLARQGAYTHRVRLSPVDFHGDGLDGEVDVVPVYGSLLVNDEAASDEQIDQFGLALAYGARAEFSSLLYPRQAHGARPRMSTSASGGVRSEGKLAPLLLGHPAETNVVGLGARTEWQTKFLEPIGDHAAADPEPFGHGKYALASDIALAEVVEVDRYAFSGQVFNLDTGEGYYSANGFVSRNCRCTLVYAASLAGGGYAWEGAPEGLETSLALALSADTSSAPSGASGTLYIARHGMTAYDSDNQASDTIRGWADDPLTPEGLAEAHRLAAALQGLGITEIHTSDLIRAAETAHVIGEALGQHPYKTGLLRPWDVGELQGQTSESAADQIAAYVDKPGTEVPGGEAFGEFAERFTAALSKAMLRVGTGETVLLVTHSHNLKFARDWLANGYESPSGEQFAVAATPPASVLVCQPAGDGWDVAEAVPQDPPGAVPQWADYRPADDPELACGTCVFFDAGECEMFDAPVDPGMVCDEFEPAALQAATLGATIGGEMASEPQITIPLNITIGQAETSDRHLAMLRSANRIGDSFIRVHPDTGGLGDFYDIEGMPFQATGSTSLPLSDRNLAWDAGAARKTLQPADFPKAHFWKDPDGPADQITSYKFPFAKRQGGQLVAVWKGVTSGAQRLSSAKGVDTGAIEKKMAVYYRKAASQYKDPTIKVPFADTVPGGEHEVDPMEVHAYLDDGAGACAICGMAKAANIHTSQIGSRDISAAAALAIGPTWRAVLCVEGEPTEDGRLLAPGSTTWRDLPLTLLCQTETAPGHDGAEVCGRIDRIWRDGMNIMGEGVFDAGEFGLEAARLVSEQTLRGISVDLAVLEYEIQQLPATDDATSLDIADGLDIPEETDEVFVVTDGVIGAATICPFQAIANATIEVLTSSGPLTLRLTRAMPAEGALTASAAGLVPARPPASWFENPGLKAPTPITVDENGRVYGHAALWGTCHIGHPGTCVTPPRSPSGYRYFHLGAVETENGEVDVGTVTLGTGHASLRLGSEEALEHYDNTGTGAAHVRVGEDQYGIWVAGALASELSAARARTLRGAKLSGDWRAIGGSLELVGLLAVNVPGFPVPRPSARVASAGEEMERVALLAAGVPEPEGFSPFRARVLAARAHGGVEAVAELARA